MLVVRWLVFLLLFSVLSAAAFGQAAEICGDQAGTNWLTSPLVYGRVTLQGFASNVRLPKITVTVTDASNRQHSQTIDRRQTYCFDGVNGSGGMIVIEVEGVEVARRSLPPSSGLRQYFETFDVYADRQNGAPPGTISAKYVYSRSDENSGLFERAVAAEKEKQFQKSLGFLKQITGNDPQDFVAWAKLGSVQFELKDLKGAETSYRRSLDVRPDFGYAMMNIGRILMLQERFAQAIDWLKKATEAEPNMPRAFQLLGEAYLLDRKGTLGVEALYEAIRLDPVGMAECHLLVATLFDRAGAKSFAAREYKLFLEKKPDHPDKKKFEKYIKDYPPEPI